MPAFHAPFRPEGTALPPIDHRLGTMQRIRNIPLETARAGTLARARAARILGMTVMPTSSLDERLQGPLMPGLREIPPEAFAARVRQAGVTSHVGLVCPSIRAAAEGVRVPAIMDASGSPFERSEEMSRRRMADGGVVLTATSPFIAELAQDRSTPQGSQLIRLPVSDARPPVHPAQAAA